MPTLLRSRAALTVVLLFAATCGGGSTGPSGNSSTLHLTLSTPHSDDGAVMFTVHGAAIDSLAFPAGYTGYFRLSTNRDTATVIVAGHVAGGVVANLLVPAGSASGSYFAAVTQVAQRTTFAERTLGGYLVSVGP